MRREALRTWAPLTFMTPPLALLSAGWQNFSAETLAARRLSPPTMTVASCPSCQSSEHFNSMPHNKSARYP